MQSAGMVFTEDESTSTTHTHMSSRAFTNVFVCPTQRQDRLTCENFTTKSKSLSVKLGMLGGMPTPALAMIAGCVWEVVPEAWLAALSEAERLDLLELDWTLLTET
eukprot:1160547-Pelagomonas_calceolata.AAC.1